MSLRNLILIFLLAASPLPAQQTPQPDLRWIQPPDSQLEVNGLHWYGEDHGEWIRLPLRLKGIVRDQVWELAQSPSGGRIRSRRGSARSYPWRVLIDRVRQACTG